MSSLTSLDEDPLIAKCMAVLADCKAVSFETVLAIGSLLTVLVTAIT